MDDGDTEPRLVQVNPVSLAADLLAAYDTQMRAAEVSGLPAGVYAETDPPITRIVGQHRGFVSGPADLGVDGAALDGLIARQREFFGARGEAVEWKTRGHDRPSGIPERLLAAGFVPEPQETVLAGLARDLAADAPALPQGVTIGQVTEETDIRRIAALESEVWGEDWSWLADDLLGRIRRGQTTVFAAEADGRILSAAWLMLKPGTEFGGLWGGSTLSQWRGRGLYRALVARRAALAAELGVRYLQVDASDDSRPILERLGLVPVTTTTPYVWTPLTGDR
jgi:GNAT superfamily N-acetyltransferase